MKNMLQLFPCIVWIILLCPELALGSSSGAGIIKVSQGDNCVILLPDNTPEPITSAANMMAGLLGRAMDLHVTIRKEGQGVDGNRALLVSLGNTIVATQHGLARDLAGKPNDSIAIGVYPQARVVCLQGIGDLGVYFAAATFLEKLFGIRWYFPGELGLVVPHHDQLELPGGVVLESPSFPMRWIGRPFAKDWALFNKMNTNLIEGKGVQVYKTAHTFHDFLPPGKFFIGHPEYYSLKRGVRIPRQLCTSNPKVQALVADAIVRLVEEQPYLDVVTLFPEDTLDFCECQECQSRDDPHEINVRKINTKWKRLGPERFRAMSRRMADFYLSVAEKVHAIKPNAKIQCGAYSAYTYPPLNYARKAHSDVFIYMAHTQCHNHPLTSPTCQINARFVEAMAGWKNIFSGVTIYEYYRKVANVDLPFPIVHSIRNDIPFYRKNGVYGMFTQFNNDYYTNGLNYFVAAKLLWDTSQDVDSLLRNFYTDFYGKASLAMRDYWSGFEQNAITSDVHFATDFAGLIKLYSGDILSRQGGSIKKALTVSGDPTVKRRIKNAYVGFEYLTKVIDYLRYAQRIPNKQSVEFFGMYNSIDSMAKEIKKFRQAHRDEDVFGDDAHVYKRLFPPSKVIDQLSSESAVVDIE